MTDLGAVAGLFRYPVKSMLGEELEASALGIDGIPGDRAWGVRDEQRGDFFVGKRCAPLMSCAAWYAPGDAARAVPRIRLPDGDDFSADAPDASERVSRALGRDVTLWPVVPEARATEAEPILPEEMRQMMAREEGEPLPDFSNPPPELLEVYARAGPFFDAFPLLLLTRQSVETLAAAAPGSQIDTRRFRANLLVDAGAEGGFPEQAWTGRRLRVGDAVMKVPATCIRCVMTTYGFADVPQDPKVMRALVKHADGNLGVYATVEEPGEVRRGDRLTVLD